MGLSSGEISVFDMVTLCTYLFYFIFLVGKGEYIVQFSFKNRNSLYLFF